MLVVTAHNPEYTINILLKLIALIIEGGNELWSVKVISNFPLLKFE